MLVISNARLRRQLSIILPWIVIPAIIACGFIFDEQSPAMITLLVTIAALLLFCSGYDRKQTGSRRLVLVAVMTALSVLGRFVFAAVPGFKPITAIVIITALWIGGESGFLVGALTALLSNFYFGQGPWTPFQMLAWGMIGLMAGYLAQWLKSSRVLLCLYGILAGVAYSLLLDVWTVLWYNSGFSWPLYTAALATAVPLMISYAVSNVVFLLLLSKPLGSRLERVKIKYGV